MLDHLSFGQFKIQAQADKNENFNGTWQTQFPGRLELQLTLLCI